MPEEIKLIPAKTVGPYTIKARNPHLPGTMKYVVFRDGEQVKECGRFTVAIRWCLNQLPRHKAHVVICIEDGQVHVLSTIPMSYTVLDVGGEEDDDGSISMPEYLVKGGEPFTYPGSVRCYSQSGRATVNPARIEIIHSLTNPPTA